MSVSYISDSLTFAVRLTHKRKGNNPASAENVYSVCRVLPGKGEEHWVPEDKTYPFEEPAIKRCKHIEDVRQGHN